MNLPVDLVPPGSDWTVTQRLKGGRSYSIMLIRRPVLRGADVIGVCC